MFFKELKKYLSYSYNQESIKLIVDKNNTTLYEQLINNGFKNVSYLDKFQNYTFKDLLIVNHENTLLNLGKNLKELNFKIVVIRKIKYNFKDFDLLFSSSIIENILSNPISIYQRKKNFEERIQVWNEYYSFHLEKLYEDKKMDLIFYFGHKFISSIPKKNKIVVDFGCGNGYHVEFENLAEIKKYYFVDQNPKTIDYLKNVKKYSNVILSNGEEIQLDNESVDYFICSHILEHIPNLGDILQRIKKKLKKNGSIILVAPCDPGFLWNFLSKFSPNRKRLRYLGLDYEEIMKYEHVNKFSKVREELKKLFIEENSEFFPFALIKNPNFNLMYFGTYKKI